MHLNANADTDTEVIDNLMFALLQNIDIGIYQYGTCERLNNFVKFPWVSNPVNSAILWSNDEHWQCHILEFRLKFVLRACNCTNFILVWKFWFEVYFDHSKHLWMCLTVCRCQRDVPVHVCLDTKWKTIRYGFLKGLVTSLL